MRLPTLLRRDLHEDLELIRRERRLQELELHGVPHSAVEILELVGLLRRLGLKLADRLADDIGRALDLLGIGRNRRRIGIHPVNRLAIAFDEARIASFLLSSEPALAISTRTVCPRNEGTSEPRAIMRILPSLSSLSPNGGAAQPMSICPVITEVRVPGWPPVEVGLALSPSSSTNATTMLLEDEPLVE